MKKITATEPGANNVTAKTQLHEMHHADHRAMHARMMNICTDHPGSWRGVVRNRITVCCEYGDGLRTLAVY